MANINNSIFKQYLGTLDEFKAYYAALDSIQQAALTRALVFIHDKEVNGAWNNDGYIFANGKYYACRESSGLTLNTLLSLIETGDTSGVDVVESDGKLVFTPVIKDELKALTSVGFVESGKIWAARTPIEDILNDIFAKEVWYKAEFNYTDDLAVTMSRPTLTVTVDEATAVNDSTYEIGTPVTVSGSMSASSATGNGFDITCLTPDNNGFVTNGDTSERLTELSVSASLTSTGTDSLSITAQGGAFKDMVVSNNALSDSSVVASGANNITLKSTSKTYTLTATPATSETTLTTLSNKGNYSSNDTEDDVLIKHTVEQTKTLNLTPTSSISFTGAYKYFIGNYSDSVFDNKIYSITSIRESDMTKSGFMNGTNIKYTTTVPTGTKGMYIAIPAGVDDNGTTLKVKQVNTNAFVNEEMVNNKRTISLTCGGTHTKDYVIFTWSYPGGTKGTEPFEITSF